MGTQITVLRPINLIVFAIIVCAMWGCAHRLVSEQTDETPEPKLQDTEITTIAPSEDIRLHQIDTHRQSIVTEDRSKIESAPSLIDPFDVSLPPKPSEKPITAEADLEPSLRAKTPVLTDPSYESERGRQPEEQTENIMPLDEVTDNETKIEDNELNDPRPESRTYTEEETESAQMPQENGQETSDPASNDQGPADEVQQEKPADKNTATSTDDPTSNDKTAKRDFLDWTGRNIGERSLGAIFLFFLLRNVYKLRNFGETWKQHRELVSLQAYKKANISNNMKKRINLAIFLTFPLMFSEIADHLLDAFPFSNWYPFLFAFAQLFVAIWILVIVFGTIREQFWNWNETAKENSENLFRRVVYFVANYYRKNFWYLLNYFKRGGSDLATAILIPSFSLLSVPLPLFADRLFPFVN